MIMQHKITTFNYTGIAVINVFLAAAAIFSMIYFVVASNIVAASSYKISLLGDELSALFETNGLLTAQKLSIEDSPAILNFARSRHMVEAGHVTHIFENSDVALQR